MSYIPIRMVRILKNTDTTKCWQGCATPGTLLRCWWEGQRYSDWKMIGPFQAYTARTLATLLLDFLLQRNENLCSYKKLSAMFIQHNLQSPKVEIKQFFSW